MSSLTVRESRAIVAGDAGSQEQCPAHSRAKNARKWGPRHGHVFDNKHMHSHIQATIGRAGSVDEPAIIKFLTHSPKAGGFCFWAQLPAASR